ncbi:MAG: HNH endonuclease domain-containing protein, partial [Neobacillus sp.]
DKKSLRKAISDAELGDAERLMKFVPFRLLIPFLEDELKDVDKGKWMVFELAMPRITNHYFDSKNPLYRFDSDSYRECRNILFNEKWAKYLEQHFSIVYSWASWHWLSYMQKRNPSTPAISSKLFMPTKRDSLAKQTTYWKKILNTQPEGRFTCIYSGSKLKADDFALDHFLPWSFVAHDQLWNLIPTPHSINSSKSNNIPDKRYFDRFIQIQYEGLLVAKQVFSNRDFDKQTENFVADLAVSPDDLLNYDKLKNAYQNTLIPLSYLAVNQGFSGNWKWL